VEEALPAAVDREHVLIFDDWPMAEGKPEDHAAGLSQIMANGAPAPELTVRANERVRLRLINAARARVIALRLDRHAANVMALDGQPTEPFRARDARVVLAPGNTADVFVDATLEPGATAAIFLADTGERSPSPAWSTRTRCRFGRHRSGCRSRCRRTRCRQGSILRTRCGSTGRSTTPGTCRHCRSRRASRSSAAAP
jgi:FtsP/CotA-like multicopper oxidase with cupredoxin domain